jgi:hypothetical protein
MYYLWRLTTCDNYCTGVAVNYWASWAKQGTPQYKRQKAAKTHRFCGFLTFILRSPKI